MEIIPNVHRIPGVRGANAYLLLEGGSAPPFIVNWRVQDLG